MLRYKIILCSVFLLLFTSLQGAHFHSALDSGAEHGFTGNYFQLHNLNECTLCVTGTNSVFITNSPSIVKKLPFLDYLKGTENEKVLKSLNYDNPGRSPPSFSS